MRVGPRGLCLFSPTDGEAAVQQLMSSWSLLSFCTRAGACRESNIRPHERGPLGFGPEHGADVLWSFILCLAFVFFLLGVSKDGKEPEA